MRDTLSARPRMRRFTTVLLPWMVLTAAAHAQTRAADVLYTYFDDKPAPAFRVGDEAFVSLDTVTAWGWKTSTWADVVDIKAEGKSVSVATRYINGAEMLPLRTALRKLGLSSEWMSNVDTLSVYGQVTSLKVHAGNISVQASSTFRPKTSVMADPSRYAVDLYGVRIDRDTKQSLDRNVRVFQYRPNVARVVIETAVPSNWSVPNNSQEAVSTLEASYPQGGDEPVVQNPTTVPKVDPAVAVKPPETPPTGQDNTLVPSQANTVLSLKVDRESGDQLWIGIAAVASGEPIFQKPDVNTLEVVLPGVFADVPQGFNLGTDSITEVTTRHIASGTVLRLGLARPMGAQVVRDSTGVHLQLLKPDVGNGHLAGKLIVVDPGHGGHDTGATGGGLQEKNLNLSIGKLIAEELAKAGATVIMTRKTDVFIPLNTRAQIAQQAHADLFISNHINSSRGTQSGGITFHHLGRPISHVLAECIQQEIAKVSGIPSMGAWSDGRIYTNGFAVLRQTTMPGVLLELGFINSGHDRARLVTDDFQHAAAKAVVRGIKVFLGDAKKKE